MKIENYYGQYYWTHRPKGFCIRAMWTLYVVDFFFIFFNVQILSNRCVKKPGKNSLQEKIYRKKKCLMLQNHTEIFSLYELENIKEFFLTPNLFWASALFLQDSIKTYLARITNFYIWMLIFLESVTSLSTPLMVMTICQ